MYPSGYKEDKIYSLKPTDGSGDLTFTRASTATRVNADGLIETASVLGTELISSTLINSNYDTFNEASVSGFHAIYSTSGTQRASTVDEINFVNGKTYKVNIDVSVVSGSVPFLRAREAVATNPTIFSGQLVDGSNVVTFTSTSTFTGLLEFASTTASEYRVSNVSVKEVITLNVPRIDYTGGGCGSLLLEKQSTNLATYSSEFDNAAWTKFNSSVTANSTTSPDGTQNAEKLIALSINSDHGVYQIPSVTLGASYTYSVFAKAGEYNFLRIADGDGNGAFFNLSNGTIVGSTSASPTIISMGSGWYRCSMTAVTSGTTTLMAVVVCQNGTNAVFTGDGTSGIYIYGAQLEQSSYPTSYIPCPSSSSVTRLADACATTGLSDVIGQTEGTMFVDVDLTHSTTGTNSYLMQIYKGSGLRILIYRDGASGGLSYYFLQAATLFNYTSLISSNGVHKLAFAYKSGDSVFYIDGVQVDTDATTFSTFTSLSELHIGANFNPTQVEIGDYKYNQAILFKTRLTNAELATLTTL